MRTRTTILLGAVFGALVAAYLFTNVRAYRAAREAYLARRIFQFEAADIATLSIQQQGAEAVEAVREKGGWRLAGARSQIEANGPLWDQLAQAVAAATNERPIAEKGADLASFELETARLSVEVGTRAGVLQQINFGGLDPMQRHRYAQLGGGGVFLARAELFSALNRSLFDLRDRRIFTNLGGGLTRVDYERLPVETGDGATLDENVKKAATAIHESYAKNDAGEWRMTSPAEVRARQDRLKLIEAALQELAGREYVDGPENLGDYGLSTPFSRLTAYGKDGAAQTLLLGWLKSDAETAGLYVKRVDAHSVAVIDARFMTVLPSEQGYFREKRLFTGEAKHVKSLRYRDSRGGFTLENDAQNGWRLAEPARAETDQAAASLYLALIKRVEGDSFPEGDASAEMDSPTLAIEFEFDDGRPASKIEVGRAVPGPDNIQMYARQDFGPITTISFDEFRSLQAEAFNFRVKTLFAFDRGLAEEVELAVDGQRYHFGQAGGRWRVIEPAGHNLEAQSDLTVFLDTLAQTAVRGVADPAPSAEVQGVETPVLEVSAKIEGPNPSVFGPIRVGNLKASASRERFVTISGRDGVYFVDQSLVDAARRCVSAVRPR